MFFWLSLGVFVGLAAASAVSYRKEMSGQAKSEQQKLLLGKNNREGFEAGDKLIFETDHFIITQVIHATDGVKNLYVGELESTEQLLLWLKDPEKTWCKALCQVMHHPSSEKEFNHIFQYDEIDYHQRFETRMRIQQPGQRLLSQEVATQIQFYEAPNRHRFAVIIQGDGDTWQLMGETHLEPELMLLPKS
ncbi:MAG: hypothetical protein CMH56_12930 [Myxococcales bacterium]|nr:hypothetical protein [Myxococcales bacterium]|tara:strand:- start:433 stop:1005 length:573 start_codon:yes stop_codon:yes gene_type:complete